MDFTLTKNRGRGRPSLGEDVRQLGVKFDGSDIAKLDATVESLRRKGYRTSQAHLVRTLAMYVIGCAGDVFEELSSKKV